VHRLEFKAMGTRNLLFVETDHATRPPEMDRVRRWVRRIERRLSRFLPDSELCALNRAAGTPFRASSVLFEVMTLALDGARTTRGLVAPSLLGELERAGYDRTFKDVVARSRPVRRGRAVQHQAGATIGLDPERRSILLPPMCRVDLGGFAKGWTADQAALRLGRVAPALVEAGGDVAVSGPRQDGSPWLVPITGAAALDPVGGILEMLRLERGGVATSGVDRRRWRGKDRWMHHIIDPRTGEPAKSDVLTATVIAQSASEAEIAAKALLILGSKKGLAWIERRPPLAALIVREDGRTITSKALRRHLAR
jgi:thiamine biosynthesis lipoprotein